MGINQMLSRAGSVADRIPGRGEFAGPAVGLVELPNRLCWSGSPVFDVMDPRRRLTLYTTLIGEGQRADLAQWINWAHLIEDWPKVRRLTARDLIGVWEKQLPDLAAVSSGLTQGVDPFHQQLARIAFDASDDLGVVLAGGYAISAHQLTSRPSRDLGFATVSTLPLDVITDRLAPPDTTPTWWSSRTTTEPRS